MKQLLTFGFFIFAIPLLGQVRDLSFKGRLLDAVVSEPIAGAEVILRKDQQEKKTITNEDGIFIFKGLSPGHYRLTFQSLGYETLTIAEVWIHSGVPRESSYAMDPSDQELTPVVVKAQSRGSAAQAINSIHTLTVEETFRFPGTFYDPARLATHYAGVISDNDQANNLVIRGNSPNLLGWHLEDVEIVNPNHLANAGTLNDRVTQSGGGVNILSAQMIDNTAFLKSTFPASYGNALSGIMDMHLREGARDQMHFTGQIGLNGIDAAIEGPLGREKQGSFLLNYRYSTLGLLSALGVDLGDEEFNFQDLSFHVKTPTGDHSTLTLFGIGGTSKNVFEGTSDATLWEEFKDRQNINYEGKMMAVGINWEWHQWKTTLAFSGNSHKRFSAIILSEQQVNSFERNVNEEGRIALHTRNRIHINRSAFLDLGIRLNQISYNNLSAQDLLGVRSQGQVDTWLLQAYSSARWLLSGATSMTAGLHFSHFELSSSSTIEPRLGLQHSFTNTSSINFSYGLHSRIPSQNALLIKGPTGEDNRHLSFLHSHQLVLGYRHQLTSLSRITAELYYQNLFDLPIGIGDNSSFSTINSIDNHSIQNLMSDGTGENMGIELSFQKYFGNGTYYQLNGSLFDSKYTGADGIRRNTRYNAQFAGNLTGGKEYTWQKKRKVKNLGLNLRVFARGGFWEGPINQNSSQILLTTIYDEQDAFTEQLPTFFKVDFRIHYKVTKENYTSILGLDILNATNRENIIYYFYNPQNQSTLPKTSLGIIPILSYRIEY